VSRQTGLQITFIAVNCSSLVPWCSPSCSDISRRKTMFLHVHVLTKLWYIIFVYSFSFGYCYFACNSAVLHLP
jgi:hypothetical protein